MHETAAKLSLDVISAQKIISEHLNFRKLSARLIPAQLVMFQQDNDCTHQTTQKIAETHLLQSPDLVQSNFHLLAPLKELLRGGIKYDNNDAQCPEISIKISMLQASRDLLRARNTVSNCMETMLRNNITVLITVKNITRVLEFSERHSYFLHSRKMLRKNFT